MNQSKRDNLSTMYNRTALYRQVPKMVSEETIYTSKTNLSGKRSARTVDPNWVSNQRTFESRPYNTIPQVIVPRYTDKSLHKHSIINKSKSVSTPYINSGMQSNVQVSNMESYEESYLPRWRLDDARFTQSKIDTYDKGYLDNVSGGIKFNYKEENKTVFPRYTRTNVDVLNFARSRGGNMARMSTQEFIDKTSKQRGVTSFKIKQYVPKMRTS